MQKLGFGWKLFQSLERQWKKKMCRLKMFSGVGAAEPEQ